MNTVDDEDYKNDYNYDTTDAPDDDANGDRNDVNENDDNADGADCDGDNDVSEFRMLG